MERKEGKEGSEHLIFRGKVFFLPFPVLLLHHANSPPPRDPTTPYPHPHPTLTTLYGGAARKADVSIPFPRCCSSFALRCRGFVRVALMMCGCWWCVVVMMVVILAVLMVLVLVGGGGGGGGGCYDGVDVGAGCCCWWWWSGLGRAAPRSAETT